MAADLKVLCITGWCRNGSTIIGNVLNEIPGFFHVGELHFLWKNAAGQGVNSLCGCGQALTECPVWSEVLASTRPDRRLARRLTPTRSCADSEPASGPGTPGGSCGAACAAGDRAWTSRAHADLMARTYRAIADRQHASVIVDTTKIPGEAALLPYLARDHALLRAPGARSERRGPVVAGAEGVRLRDVGQPQHRSTGTASTWRRGRSCGATRSGRCCCATRTSSPTPAATIDTLLRLCGTDTTANPGVRPHHRAAHEPHRDRQPGPVPHRRDADPRPRRRLDFRAPRLGPSRSVRALLAAVPALRLRQQIKRLSRVRRSRAVGSRA